MARCLAAQDWPVDHSCMPTSEGEAVPYGSMIDEMLQVKASGDKKAMAVFKHKFDTPSAYTNLSVVLDRQAREQQILLTVLAAGRPDVVAFEEVRPAPGWLLWSEW